MAGKKRNGYAAFVDDYSKKTGISMQEAFKVCGDLWTRLPESERTTFKLGRGSSLALDTFGNPITSAEDEDRITKEQAFRMRQFVETKLDTNGGDLGANVYQDFVTIHVNAFCKTVKGQVVPAEIAAVRFNIKEGVKDYFHEILRPAAIPEGYLRETIQRAEKSHNIPHNNDDVGERNLMKVRRRLNQFLHGERSDVEPVFCLGEEIEDVKKALKALMEKEHIEVFDLGVILSEIQKRVKGQEETINLTSADLANHYLEEDRFLYKTASVDSCNFHHSLDNVRFCSLNISKRRVWSICERSTRIFGFTLENGKHLPNEEVWTGPDEAKQFVDSEEEEEMDEFRKAAIVKKSKNPFGTKVPRCGSMGGHTALPGRDPTFEIQEKIKQAENKLTGDLLNLSIKGKKLDHSSNDSFDLNKGMNSKGYENINKGYDDSLGINDSIDLAKNRLTNDHWLKDSPAFLNSPSRQELFTTSDSASAAPTGTTDFFSSADEDDGASVVSAVTAVSAASGTSSRRSRPKIWAHFVTKGQDPPSTSSIQEFPPLGGAIPKKR